MLGRADSDWMGSGLRWGQGRAERGHKVTDRCREARTLWALHTSVGVLQVEGSSTTTWKHRHSCAETNPKGRTKEVSAVLAENAHLCACL